MRQNVGELIRVWLQKTSNVSMIQMVLVVHVNAIQKRLLLGLIKLVRAVYVNMATKYKRTQHVVLKIFPLNFLKRGAKLTFIQHSYTLLKFAS